MGAVPSQVWEDGEHPITYDSRKMNASEMNYLTHERELSVVIHALRVWRQYLLGKRFKIFTDHYSLKYLTTQPNLSKRQARWVEMLAKFDFEVVHRPRKSNVVADALPQLNSMQVGPASRGHHMKDLVQGAEIGITKRIKKQILFYRTWMSIRKFRCIQNKLYYIGKGTDAVVPSPGEVSRFYYVGMR